MPCVTNEPSLCPTPTLFRAAATRLSTSPTAALALALDASGGEVTRLSPATGSFDPPTAAALSAWHNP